MSFEYWFMFPAAVVIATVAMASGVEGATFFTPLFLLVLRLPIEVAVGTGLITEVFGFGSGLFAYWRKRLIDYKLGMNLLVATIPAAILGTWIAAWIAPDLLKAILAMGLVAVAVSFLRAPGAEDVARLDESVAADAPAAATCLVTSDGEEICYTVCNRTEGGLIAATGAVFMGMISTGLGEMNAYFLLQRCRVPSAVSVATSVFVVAITALVAASGHLVAFVREGGDTLTTVLNIAIFTVPGVIVGGQIGPVVAKRISEKTLTKGLAILFLLIAAVMFYDVVT